MTVRNIDKWFSEAKPNPTTKDTQTQIGVHFEEVAEMIEELKGKDRLTQSMLTNALVAIHGLALHLKTSKECQIEIVSRIRFIDALCDQIVTATGSGNFCEMDVPGALREVDDSNWSKFVDGKAIVDENGKIQKGPDYFKPDLAHYV